jgi:hypothetical protein
MGACKLYLARLASSPLLLLLSPPSLLLATPAHNTCTWRACASSSSKTSPNPSRHSLSTHSCFPVQNKGGIKRIPLTMEPAASKYQFTTPYPQPKYTYPTAHVRTRSDPRVVTAAPAAVAVGKNGKPKKPYRAKGMGRATSPTPSEREEMKQSFIDKRFWSWAFYRKPKTICTLTHLGRLTAGTDPPKTISLDIRSYHHLCHHCSRCHIPQADRA